MSTPDASFNPYAADMPSYAPQYSPGAGRSAWYTFYCIIGIILGGLGLTASIVGTGTLIVSKVIGGPIQFPAPVPAAGAQGGPAQEMAKFQQEMMADMNGVQDRYQMFQFVAMGLLFFIALAILIGGIRALQMKRQGANLLRNAFMAASIFEVGRLILTIVMQMEIGQIMSHHLSKMVEQAGANQPAGNAPPAEFLSQAMMIGVGIGVCFAVVWVVIKLVIYLSGWIYLQKPSTLATLHD